MQWMKRKLQVQVLIFSLNSCLMERSTIISHFTRNDGIFLQQLNHATILYLKARKQTSRIFKTVKESELNTQKYFLLTNELWIILKAHGHSSRSLHYLL